MKSRLATYEDLKLMKTWFDNKGFNVKELEKFEVPPMLPIKSTLYVYEEKDGSEVGLCGCGLYPVLDFHSAMIAFLVKSSYLCNNDLENAFSFMLEQAEIRLKNMGYTCIVHTTGSLPLERLLARVEWGEPQGKEYLRIKNIERWQ